MLSLMWYDHSRTLGSFVPGTNYLPSLPAADTQAIGFHFHSRNGINRLSVERWLTKLGSLRFHPSRPLQISSKIPSTKHERNMMVRSWVFNCFVTPSPTTKVKTVPWPSRILHATLSRLGHRVGCECDPSSQAS